MRISIDRLEDVFATCGGCLWRIEVADDSPGDVQFFVITDNENKAPDVESAFNEVRCRSSVGIDEIYSVKRVTSKGQLHQKWDNLLEFISDQRSVPGAEVPRTTRANLDDYSDIVRSDPLERAKRFGTIVHAVKDLYGMFDWQREIVKSETKLLDNGNHTICSFGWLWVVDGWEVYEGQRRRVAFLVITDSHSISWCVPDVVEAQNKIRTDFSDTLIEVEIVQRAKTPSILRQISHGRFVYDFVHDQREREEWSGDSPVAFYKHDGRSRRSTDRRDPPKPSAEATNKEAATQGEAEDPTA